MFIKCFNNVSNLQPANNNLRIDFVFSRITLSNFFVKFANQNFPSVKIFVFGETTKFLFTLQARHISAYSPVDQYYGYKPIP